MPAASIAADSTPTVIIVTHFVSAAVGHGGHHRSHQIEEDCRIAVGAENVVVLSWPMWLEEYRGQMGAGGTLAAQVRQGADGAMNRVRRARYKLRHLVQQPHFTPLRFAHPAFAAHYQNVLKARPPGPKACVIEDAGFSQIAQINARLKIPTVICPHNLESLEESFDVSRLGKSRAVFRDLQNELAVFSRCDERLFISKVEAGIASGIGLESRFYPYRAVGEIENNLLQARHAREKTRPDPNLFLMLGSANHASTEAGFRWFLEQAKAHGLPESARIVVGGAGTRELAARVPQTPGIEFRGWLEQDELNQLMASACALLIPQPFGFGALTRLAELEAAGVPFIVSEHATFAVDVPLNARVVAPEWNSWRDAMRAAQQDTQQNAQTLSSRESVEAVAPPSVLAETLKRLLGAA